MTESLIDYYLSSLWELDIDEFKGKPSLLSIPSKHFVHIKSKNAWRLRRDSVGNELTQTIVRHLDAWQLPCLNNRSNGMPGGIGAKGVEIWVPFLDGGLYLETMLWEGETTNHLHAQQSTIVVGKEAYRTLWKALAEGLAAQEIPQPPKAAAVWPKDISL